MSNSTNKQFEMTSPVICDDAPSTKGTIIREMTTKILEHVAIELQKSESQEKLKEKVIDPLIRIFYSHMFPYVMITCAVVLIILLTSLCTCTMFAVFFFQSR
jgi:hypothetical protein